MYLSQCLVLNIVPFNSVNMEEVIKLAKGVPPSKYFAAQADAPADGPDHQ